MHKGCFVMVKGNFVFGAPLGSFGKVMGKSCAVGFQ
jgi:hypothetical protein